MAKHPLKQITLKSAEGPWFDRMPLSFTTFHQAQQHLRLMKGDAPLDRNGYDKVHYVIEWTDGETYEGRIDLVRNHFESTTHLGERIQFLLDKVYRTQVQISPDRPDLRLKVEQLERFLSNHETIDVAPTKRKRKP